ncbi:MULTISPECIES: hypothetical protein [unclassified Bradyrhizobium]|uniref:hypothetical protein n=1 Tax=unclassified Bradyrhizobium TaxID=2631580 RepID=UPI00291640EA|nr:MULTISPECIES: hypothetical protein [unclassified Bradyrhizobium]
MPIRINLRSLGTELMMHDPYENPGTHKSDKRSDQHAAASGFQTARRLEASPALQPNREPSDSSGPGANHDVPVAADHAGAEKVQLVVPTMWR